ncbi:ATP-binding cassette domain-containing protein [Nocardioides hungaricus]
MEPTSGAGNDRVDTVVTTTDADAGEVVLRVEGVKKSFGHVSALRGVSLEVRAGEIVAIVGDNGAGKSTLASVISGALLPDEGHLEIAGERVDGRGTKAVSELGVETVYQNLALAPDLSIAANLFLGREQLGRGWLHRRLAVLDKRAMADRAETALVKVGWDGPPPTTRVSDLSGGQQQAVAVARAMVWATRAILMDEPTAALAQRQMQKTNEIIRAAAQQRLGVVVITHDLPNMLTYAHRIVVMRRGAIAAQMRAEETSTTELVEMMVSREGEDGLAA